MDAVDLVLRHQVREHTRRGRTVNEYTRGTGSRAVMDGGEYRGERSIFERGGGSTELSAEVRDRLSAGAFAIPNERAYPVPTVDQLEKAGAPRPEVSGPRHALNALQRVTQRGGPYEQRAVHAMVKSRYPDVYDRWAASRR